MKKMSKTEEARMVDVIGTVMGKIAKGENPTEAVIKAAGEIGMSPGAAARICEACNKMLSIDRLAEGGPDRAGEYPLADAQAVIARLGPAPDEAPRVVVIRKTASEGVPKHAGVVWHERSPEDLDRARYRDLLENKQKATRAVKKAMEEYVQEDDRAHREEMLAAEDYDGLVAAAEKLDDPQALDLARYIQSVYGELGETLIKMLAESLGRELPETVGKEASAFVAPKGGIYARVDRFMERGARRLEALADRDLALKKAADGITDAVASILSGAEKSFPKEDPVEGGESPFSAEMVLRMRNLALKDNFANMYLDDRFLLQYPPETVLDAYNKVMQLHPEISTRQNADALVTAMVKRVITSNNELDPLEIPAALAAGKSLVDSQSRRDTSKWD